MIITRKIIKAKVGDKRLISKIFILPRMLESEEKGVITRTCVFLQRVWIVQEYDFDFTWGSPLNFSWKDIKVYPSKVKEEEVL